MLNRGELISGATDVEYFAPVRFRLKADLLVAVLGTTAAYLSQAEMVLTADHPWVQQAQAAHEPFEGGGRKPFLKRLQLT